MQNAIEQNGEILPKYEGVNAPYFIDESGYRHIEQDQELSDNIIVEPSPAATTETLIGESQEVIEEWLAVRAAAIEAAKKSVKPPTRRQQRENAQNERTAHYRRVVKQVRA